MFLQKQARNRWFHYTLKRFGRQEPICPVVLSRMGKVWYTPGMGSRQGFRFPVTAWVVLVTAMALVVRLGRLGFQPLWWDEGWSIYFATTDPGTMLGLTAVDIHPPLYYLLLHVWIKLVGAGPVAVRLLSVLIGTAAAPLVFLVGRRWFRPEVGLAAALLLAFSPFHVYYSQEVRMYGLVTLLGLAALWFACPGAQAKRRWWAWVGYVVVAAAALYTQYYAAFLILALNMVAVFRWMRERRHIRDFALWLAAQAAVAALYLPWLWYAGGKLLTYVRYKVAADKDLPLDPLTYVARHLAAFAGGHAEGALAGWWWLGLVPLAALAVAGLLFLARRRRTGERAGQGAGIWLAVVAIVLCCGYLVNLVFPFNPPRVERLLLLALPAFLLAVAAALAALWRQWRLLAIVPAALLLAVSLLSLGFFYTVPRYPDDDYRPVAARIEALGLPADAVICVHPWQVGYFESYLSDPRPALVLTPREVIPQERQLWADDPALMAAELEDLLAPEGRLWVPAHQTMGRVLEEKIGSYLAGHAYPALSEWYGEHTLLSLYAAGEPRAAAVTARFDGWLALDGAALGAGPLDAGWGVLPVDLVWRLEGPAPAGAGDLVVGLRLVDAAGRVWAQRDGLPGAGLTFSGWAVGEPGVDRYGLPVPAGTPPGDYQVTLRVYLPPDSVLPVAFAGGSGGEVVLGAVRVARPAAPPPVEALDLGRPLQADFGRLRLLGLSLHGGLAYRTGEPVEVDLFWQALAAPGEDYLPRLQLLDAAGTVCAELAEKPVAGAYPTAWWQAGELVRDPHALSVPAATPAGRYRLALSLVRAVDGSSPPSVDLAEVEVEGREHGYDLPAIGHGQVAQFGPAVELIGYDLVEAAQPGSPLEVTLYWHARQTPDKNYRVFVHLLDAGGQIVAQHDGAPGDGELPALGWLPGEYLTDTHRLALPAELPAGAYNLLVGLYDPVTRQRLGEPILLDTPVTVSLDK